MAKSKIQFHIGQAPKDSFLGGVMQRQILNSDRALKDKFAGRFGAVLAMTGLLMLSACSGGGNDVTENNLPEPGMDGVPPTLTTVTIQPNGYVALGQTVRIDMVATEALMTPVVTINGVEADVTGSIKEWRATRKMNETDPIGEVSFSIAYQDISGELGEDVSTTTNGSAADYCAEDCPVEELGPLEGKWKLDLAGYGPAEGDVQWWNTDMGTVVQDRACWFDDTYEFDADGSFRNVQGDETWLEPWQGVAEGCGAPVAPHDGSNNAIFQYDEAAQTLKLTGRGAFLALPKAVNGVELTDPALAPESVTYNVFELLGDSLTVTINTGAGWWTYELTRISNSPVVGKWKLSLEGGAGFGPVAGDIQWWNTDMGSVVDDRACWFDDIYHFGDDGSFQNYPGTETWLETWQGVAEATCGAPVAPHDGANAGSFSYDADAGTLKLNGQGAHLGLPKAVNGGEIAEPAAAPESITYDVLDVEGDTMTVSINVGNGWWTFKLERATDTTDLRGKWQLNRSGGVGFGPTAGDIQWWNTDMGTVVQDRACWFDDVFDFGRDGSFDNDQGGETWLEEWQGVVGATCAEPVAPHDGSARAIYDYDEAAGTLTFYGKGAHLGLAKAVNGGELATPESAPESITYDVLALEGNNMEVAINVGNGWWTYKLVRTSSSPLAGNWKLSPEGGAGFGPVAGDIQWWNTDMGTVVQDRACWFDDVYHFGGGGSFQNFQDGETWLETWQGVAEATCGAPVAPHDGSAAGVWIYDDAAMSLMLNGRGSHLGLPKAVNDGELSDPEAAPQSVTYDVLSVEGDAMEVSINVGNGWWTYKLEKE